MHIKVAIISGLAFALFTIGKGWMEMTTRIVEIGETKFLYKEALDERIPSNTKWPVRVSSREVLSYA